MVPLSLLLGDFSEQKLFMSRLLFLHDILQDGFSNSYDSQFSEYSMIHLKLYSYFLSLVGDVPFFIDRHITVYEMSDILLDYLNYIRLNLSTCFDRLFFMDRFILFFSSYFAFLRSYKIV